MAEKIFLNKFALITGASRGIGKAIALEFAKKGATVIITYHSDSSAAEIVCREVKKLGSKCYSIKADLSEEKERLNLKKSVLKITNRIDILVNNAGIFDDTDGTDASLDTLNKLFALHSIAVARLCSLFRPLLSKQASIINISSIHGVHARPHAMAYSASKAATLSITQSLAQELAPIRVNTVSPGPVETDQWGNDKKLMNSVSQKILLKRFGQPEEIAKVVAFLASDDASFITGTNIIVDGGNLLN